MKMKNILLSNTLITWKNYILRNIRCADCIEENSSIRWSEQQEVVVWCKASHSASLLYLAGYNYYGYILLGLCSVYAKTGYCYFYLFRILPLLDSKKCRLRWMFTIVDIIITKRVVKLSDWTIFIFFKFCIYNFNRSDVENTMVC